MPRSVPSRAIIGIISAVVLIIILVAAVSFLTSGSKSQSTTTSNTTSSATTTVMPNPKIDLSSCTTITSPGQYFLVKNIYLTTPASCIVIKSNNVKFAGQGNLIHGIGPYLSVPPFSYGIDIAGVNNVSVSDVRVSNFSYGIAINTSSNINVSNDNASSDVVAGIYLLNSYHNTINNNIVSFIQGKEGAISVQSSYDNNITRNNVHANAGTGFLLNGTGNKIANNTISNNPVDFQCSPTTGISNTNVFHSNACATNLYCSFVQCSSNNVPVNLSAVRLQSAITSCGGIYSPGNYSLNNDLSARNYLNTSNPAAEGEACITVLAPNVNLNCKNHAISNAGTGILLNNVYANVTNCKIENNTYGIYSNQQIDIKVRNTSIANGNYGLYLHQIISGSISNVQITGETYGVYLYNSSGVVFKGLNMTSNGYGFYIKNNSEDTFAQNHVLNNSNEDFFCDLNTYASMTAVTSGNVCNRTDCQWAVPTCSTLVPPPLANIPLNTCTTITSSGNYYLTANIAQTSTCINIKTNNVNLNCAGHFVGGPGLSVPASGISINGQNNVTAYSCDLARFSTAINITNSKNIHISNMSEPLDGQGISVLQSSGVTIRNVTVSNFSGSYGLLLQGSSGVQVTNVTTTGGPLGSSSFILNQSSLNFLKFDKAMQSGRYGFALINSTMNNIVNDTSLSASAYDFYCSGASKGIYSENATSIDYGITKYGCLSVLVLNTLVPAQCLNVGRSGSISLSTDLLYPYGGTCFSIAPQYGTANNTILNCQGHTVLATHGGTFLSVLDSSGVELENCYLKNFTTPVSEKGSSLEITGSIYNNTIAGAASGIVANNTFNFIVSNNILFNVTGYGILYQNGRYGGINRNTESQVNSCIYLINGIGDNVNTNMCSSASTGISFVNNTQSVAKNNVVLNSVQSFFCGINSNTANSFSTDQGGNVCSSSNNCDWMTNSPSCRPTS